MSREIDYLIAEKVLDLPCLREDAGILLPIDVQVKKYSTDMRAAWLVVEKMQWWKAENDLSTDGSVMWHFRVGKPPNHEWFSAHADTAPMAICLAALKAVEEPLDNE